MSTDRKISRRTWLKGMAVVSVAAMLASTPAEAKTTKAAVHYQDYPNGGRSCRICKFFIASGFCHHGMMGGGGRHCMGRGMMMGTGACQLVEGRISPAGYCDLYAPFGT